MMKSTFFSLLFAAIPAICLAQEPPMPAAPQVPMQAPPMQPPPMQPQMPAAPSPNIGDPGYYGQIDLAGGAPPPVVYSTPVVVQQTPVYYPPVYLRVPPLYYQNWPQYCGYYNACFYPVFFVQDAWYVSWYSPWYRRYYPYGRPGFSARVYYNPHFRGGARNEREWHHDDHHR